MYNVKALLAKAFTVDSKSNTQLCIQTMCYGCLYNRASQRDHDICLSSLPEKYERIFDKLISMADHDHITRLFKDYLRQLEIFEYSVPCCYFDYDARMKLFTDDYEFRILVISYALDNIPIPAASPIKTEPRTPPKKKRKLGLLNL